MYTYEHQIVFDTHMNNANFAGDYTTWDTWRLIPVKRPYVSSPSVSEKLIEIPGRNGLLDLTNVLTGSAVYGNRTGTWDFYMAHEDWSSMPSNKRFGNWADCYQKILSDIQGKQLKVALMDEAARSTDSQGHTVLTVQWYYVGRVNVSDFEPDKSFSKITLSYNFEPFRKNSSGQTKL